VFPYFKALITKAIIIIVIYLVSLSPTPLPGERG
jgi:hypothetical protein